MHGVVPPMVTTLATPNSLDVVSTKRMVGHLLYGLGQGQIGFLKGVKAALAEMGLIKNVLSAPFTPFKGMELKAVRAALARIRKMGAE